MSGTDRKISSFEQIFRMAGIIRKEQDASDGPLGNSPERATGRRTSPSEHACPTPHNGKTPRRPAPCTPTRTQPPPVRRTVSRTRPTHAAQPRRQAPTPRTHVVAPAPAAHARRTSAPRAQARPGHARPRMRTRQPPETWFSAYGRRARSTPATRALPVHMALDREA